MIGFFLRALRICSPEFLQAEFDYIIDTFLRLKFPLALLLSLRDRSRKIHARSNNASGEKQPRPASVIVPNVQNIELVAKAMRPSLSVVTVSGTKIGQLVKGSKPKPVNSDSVVYEIPCGACEKSYYGETGRSFKTRIREHRYDLTVNNDSSALVIHAMREGHLPNWKKAVTLHEGMTRLQRRAIEAAYISTKENINSSKGFFKMSRIVSGSIKDFHRKKQE